MSELTVSCLQVHHILKCDFAGYDESMMVHRHHREALGADRIQNLFYAPRS
ncbi:hypothetical protein [Desulfopila inferna]|uniref:hypothetical protein n=1 Tax=Desulfopila inferna TaxID=468528 RepID=UPI001962F8BC|nr:hypothetical protein [Desulfopila inferna]MBM9605328.1 hypothetical protein [Desulfopila inferna]